MTIQMPHSLMRACWGSSTTGVDHSRAPIFDALYQECASRSVPFATPGHKGGYGADSELVELLGDRLFAADLWLNTGTFSKTLREAEALAADAWGAERAHYLVNGSSSGNHAFFLAALRPGDEVVIARDIHTSLLTALILTGASPVYVTPRFHAATGMSLGVHPDDVAVALDAHPRARLVALARPNYYGIATDLPGIVRAAHCRGIPVYVDEAWGSHLRFHPDLPLSAMECGADAAVTSAHKLLGTLSQGSILLLQGSSVDYERVATTVAMTQSTSPLLPILASIDTARRQMALDGEVLLGRAISLADDARRRLLKIPGLDVLDGRARGVDGLDPTRLVIDVAGSGLTGYAVERLLRERFGIAPEMSDEASVICIVTIGDTRDSIDRLIGALEALAAGSKRRRSSRRAGQVRSLGRIVAAGPRILTPRDAFYATSHSLPLEAIVGEIAAELIVPYPPGVPVVAPGELITADKVAYLQAGLRRGMCVRGAADPSLATVRVVA